MPTLRATLAASVMAAALVFGGASGAAAALPAVAPTPTPTPTIDPAAPEPPETDHGPTDEPTVAPWPDGARLSDAPVSPFGRLTTVPPLWKLPFELNMYWSSGGPHADSDGTARGAVDFSPGSSPSRRVVSIAAGRVYQLLCPNGWFLGVDHGNGWKSEYYHLTNAQSGLIGSWIAGGTYLGEAGNTLPCGGSSNGPHVHLSILYGTVPQPGPGVQRPYYPISGMRFGGYTVTAGAASFSGVWRNSSGATVITNWGCCLYSTTTPSSRRRI